MTKGHKSLEVETRRNETKYEGLTFSKRLKNVEASKLESLESCWRKAKSAANDTLPWLGESSHVGQDLPQKSLIHLILGDQRKFDAKASRSATLRSRCPSSWKAKWKKNAVKNMEKQKTKLLLCNCHDACLTVPSEKTSIENTSGRLQSGRFEVAKGKGPMALTALMALYNSVCRAQASEISDLKFSTAACMASSLHRWRQSTTHQTRWHLTRRKKHSCEVKVFLDLAFSLSCLDLYHGWWLLYDSWSFLVMLLEDLCEIPWMFSVEIHVTALGQHLMFFRSKILKGHMFSKILWPPIVSFLRGQETSASETSNRKCAGSPNDFCHWI